MDSGFYSADYLRAWIRSAQLRQYLVREVGEDWWRRPETGERLRDLFREGTRPTSEEIAGAARLRAARHRPAAARARGVAPVLDMTPRCGRNLRPESGLRFAAGPRILSAEVRDDEAQALEVRRGVRGGDSAARRGSQRSRGEDGRRHRRVCGRRVQGRNRLLAHRAARRLRRRVHPGPALRARLRDQGHERRSTAARSS